MNLDNYGMIFFMVNLMTLICVNYYVCRVQRVTDKMWNRIQMRSKQVTSLVEIIFNMAPGERQGKFTRDEVAKLVKDALSEELGE
jgi:hypothetical protein